MDEFQAILSACRIDDGLDIIEAMISGDFDTLYQLSNGTDLQEVR